MPLPKEKMYTIADVYALPEGQRAELLDGKIKVIEVQNGRCKRILDCESNERDGTSILF